MGSTTYSAFFKINLKKKDLAPAILSSLKEFYPLKQSEEKSGVTVLKPAAWLERRELPFVIPPLRKLFADVRKELQGRKEEEESFPFYDTNFPFFDLQVSVWENAPGHWRKEKPLKGSSDHYLSRIQVGDICFAERIHYDSDMSGKVGSLHRGILINYVLFFWQEPSSNSPESTIIPLLDNEARVSGIFESFDRYG